MLSRKNRIAMLGMFLFAVLALGDPVVYVVTQNQSQGTQLFGTADLVTGSFNQIGPSVPIGEVGLVSGPSG